MEQLFSYLSRWNSTTKSMLAYSELLIKKKVLQPWINYVTVYIEYLLMYLSCYIVNVSYNQCYMCMYQ